MEDLICPVCGEPNPPESETCSNCGSSLHAPIQPGEAPTRQNTSELEPILPDWLREAREKARDTDAREITQPLKKAGAPSSGSSDLLAGLNAQSKDDEAEVPDWLASITGAKSPKKPPETSGPRRVELNDFTAAGSGEEEEPTNVRASEASSDPLAWLSDLSEPGTQKPSEDDLQDWFKQTVAPTPPAQETPPAVSSDAGLMDWLDDLKSENPAPEASDAPESSLPAWLGGAEEETPPASSAETGGVPDWLKDLQSKTDSAGSGAGAPTFSDESLLSDWSTGAEAGPPAEEEKPEPVITPGDLPDWLNELRAASDLPDEPVEDASAEIPSAPVEPGNFAWLREMQEAASAPEPEKPTPAFEDSSFPPLEGSPLEGSGNLDWLKDMQAEGSVTPEQLPTPALSEEPDWFTQASTEATPQETPQPPSPLDVELPEWLRDATPESLAAPEESAELPDWMKTVPTGPAETPAESEMPDWLSTPAAQAPAVEEPAASQPPIPVRPGWLSGIPPVEQPPAEQPPFMEEGELPLPALPGATLPSGGLDSLFTAMPDWLSEAAPTPSGEPAAAPTPTSEASPGEPLTPANLPSWVQAMRPVEAVPSGPQGGEDTLETQGPLAGLRGVLPALPYLGPANRPQAQSLKLNASNEQQNHGALLEQVLQSEVHPVPVAAAPRIYVQRGLHLVIGLLLFAALLGAVVMGTRILPLPVGWPAETVSAVKAVESIPAGAQVLVVFDYEPSLAGEMEATAAPLLDHLIIRTHPIFTLISTSPTGTALAERMFSGPLAELAYQDRVNLGYLPGGLGGVRSFVQNAAAAMPLAADSTPVIAGVRPYSEYAAILVITDSVEGGRTWIEQAGPPYYNGTAFVVVSSAQAGPILQPYYHSGQINGLVSGLFDAAVLEQNNAGRPGLARAYWDAFNLGLILSVALITVGALWSLISALRERNSAEAG